MHGTSQILVLLPIGMIPATYQPAQEMVIESGRVNRNRSSLQFSFSEVQLPPSLM